MSYVSHQSTGYSRILDSRILRIDEVNNIWLQAKYCQMASQSSRWRCGWEFLGNTWSNKSNANVIVEDSGCTVGMLLVVNEEKSKQILWNI